MKAAVGLLLLPLAGLWVLRSPRVARATLAARVALSAGVGAVETGAVMLLLAFVGVRWSPAIVLIPAFVGGTLGLRPPRPGSPRERRGFASMHLPALMWIAVSGAALAALGLALLTARGTSVDYLLFWGTKGFRFAMARTVDTAFLSRPDHLLMHPDYPPLVALLYASCTLLGGASWWIGLATTWFFVCCSAVALWGLLSQSLSIARTAEATALGCVILALGILVPFSGGNAEAVLLFFVTTSLGVLTCLPRGRFDWLVSVMLAGAVLTKLEGGVFSVLVVLVYGVRGGRGRSMLVLGSAPALALGLWLTFAQRWHLISVYRHPYSRFALSYLPKALLAMVHSADYGAFYIPWLAVAALWFSAPHRSEGLPAICVGVLYFGFALFSYLHPDQYSVDFIAASSARVLLTGLMCFFFAGVASFRERSADPSAESARITLGGLPAI